MINTAIRPSHYCNGRKYEPKDVIRDWELNFNLGNAVKYIARAGKKDYIVQDLEKAKQYIEFEIEYLKEKEIDDLKREYIERFKIDKYGDVQYTPSMVITGDDDGK